VGIGTPEDIAANKHSHTGRFLKDVMRRKTMRSKAAE
jgi:excinuclease UvrABC ATPase subunit